MATIATSVAPIGAAVGAVSSGPSIWWAIVGVILVAIVWESDARAGGLLLAILVFGMLLTAKKNGTVNFGAT